MLMPSTSTKLDRQGDEIEMIVSALREKFGDDAMTVAQIQLNEADEQTQAMWEATVARLSG